MVLLTAINNIDHATINLATLLVSYKIEAYVWPVPPEMWYCIYYELNQCPLSAISPLSVPLPPSLVAIGIDLFVQQWSSVTSQ